MRFLLFIFINLIFCQAIFAQEKKEVEIINADLLRFTEIDGKKLTKLIGNVQLKQDGVYMNCDSALLDKETNTFDAFGSVHIVQDTTHTYANFLHYDGATKIATLRNRVILTDGKARILTEELFYKIQEKLAYYVVGGKVYRQESIITSRAAYYFSNSGDVFFNGKVVIVDPQYKLNSDTLQYNVNTDLTTFYGNTIIYNKESEIHCNNGWFDTKQSVASFGKNTEIINGSQLLKADSLYYDRAQFYGRAFNGFSWTDSSMGIEIHAKRGDFYDEQKRMYAYQNAFAIYKMDNDSLFVSGDTLFSKEHSEIDTTKDFMVYHHVKIYMRTMQGVCDSLFYSMSDSTFRFYYSPILWSDSTQLSGDSIHLTIKERKADLMILYQKALIVSPESSYYNQIQGRIIYGYFKDNSLSKMKADGNAESLYFGKDDKDKYIGANRATCVNMWMYFGEKKIEKVVFIDKPEAVFTPMKLLVNDDKFLPLFHWDLQLKPASREEIMFGKIDQK